MYWETFWIVQKTKLGNPLKNAGVNVGHQEDIERQYWNEGAFRRLQFMPTNVTLLARKSN